MGATHWHRWLDEARALPPDHELWAELDVFIDFLSRLRGEKLAEAAKIRLSRQLDATLTQIVEEHGDLLRFLGLSVPPVSFTSRSVDLDLIRDQIEALGGLLTALSDLRRRPCESFAEEEKRADETRRVRAEVARRLAALDAARTLAVRDGHEHADLAKDVLGDSGKSAEVACSEPESGETELANAVNGSVDESDELTEGAPAFEVPAERAPSEVPDHRLGAERRASESGAVSGSEVEVRVEVEIAAVAASGGAVEVETEDGGEAEVCAVPLAPNLTVVDVPPDGGRQRSGSAWADRRASESETLSGSEVEVEAAAASGGAETEAADGGEAEVCAAPGAPNLTVVDVPPDDGRQRSGSAWGSVDEHLLSEQCGAFVDSSAPELVSALVEQQRRWLLRGQLLRGYLAARHLEDRTFVGESPVIPAWLCWLVLLLSDPGALRIDLQAQDFTLQLHGLSAAPQAASAQRFLFCWLGVALLGPQPQRAVQLAFHLKPALWEGEWAHDDLFFFCRRYLIEPARQGKQPRIRSQDTPDDIRQRIRERTKKAGEIMSLNNNYRNALVKRYWFHLVGKGGPVEQLLNGARQGTLPDPLPSVTELANNHGDWTLIEADYRRNMERRLDNFLDVLREVLVLQHQLRAQQVAFEQQTVLSQAEIEKALKNAPALIAQVEREGCPSLAGLQHLVKRLYETQEQRA